MPIIINLKEDLKNEEFISKKYSIPFKNLDLPEEYSSNKENVDVDLYIIKEKDGYVLSMNIDSDINLQCGRCLEPYNINLSPKSNIILSKEKLEGNSELSEEDLNVEYLEDEENFNLNELIREEILVDTPMKPLCSEDCKGICPICGANKNIEPCNCEAEQRKKESPFSKLNQLLEKK